MTTDRLSNWHRWGTEDERGTLNLLTPEVVLGAVRIPTRGKVYSLGLQLDSTIPVTPTRNPTWHIARPRPRKGPGGRGTADDILVTHTHVGTHIDALSHVWYDNQLYNGYLVDTITVDGAEKNAITNVPWMVARGVLLDIAGHRGVERLNGGKSIPPQELQECARKQGVSFRPGDFLVLRTGWGTLMASDPQAFQWHEPGVGESCLQWFAQQDFCGIGADNFAVEVIPPEKPKTGLKVHATIIRDLGGYIIENLYLEEIARDKVYEFLFVVAPLKITKGLGSPVNPLAIA